MNYYKLTKLLKDSKNATYEEYEFLLILIQNTPLWTQHQGGPLCIKSKELIFLCMTRLVSDLVTQEVKDSQQVRNQGRDIKGFPIYKIKLERYKIP